MAVYKRNDVGLWGWGDTNNNGNNNSISGSSAATGAETIEVSALGQVTFTLGTSGSSFTK